MKMPKHFSIKKNKGKFEKGPRNKEFEKNILAWKKNL